MNRNEFQDRLNYCRREFEMLSAARTDCTRCANNDATANVCQKFGPIPVEFVAQGCDEWEFDEVPF
jgi:hypothetical protein